MSGRFGRTAGLAFLVAISLLAPARSRAQSSPQQPSGQSGGGQSGSQAGAQSGSGPSSSGALPESDIGECCDDYYRYIGPGRYLHVTKDDPEGSEVTPDQVRQAMQGQQGGAQPGGQGQNREPDQGPCTASVPCTPPASTPPSASSPPPARDTSGGAGLTGASTPPPPPPPDPSTASQQEYERQVAEANQPGRESAQPAAGGGYRAGSAGAPGASGGAGGGGEHAVDLDPAAQRTVVKNGMDAIRNGRPDPNTSDPNAQNVAMGTRHGYAVLEDSNLARKSARSGDAASETDVNGNARYDHNLRPDRDPEHHIGSNTFLVEVNPADNFVDTR
ncbi:MAG TPA: hypothetical protein VNI01_08525 [Elusimicrobiota bacterium]|jgi:hypothetical protein|nr:hypothetical protein [Elusimicrobiota bacterium]